MLFLLMKGRKYIIKKKLIITLEIRSLFLSFFKILYIYNLNINIIYENISYF